MGNALQNSIKGFKKNGLRDHTIKRPTKAKASTDEKVEKKQPPKPQTIADLLMGNKGFAHRNKVTHSDSTSSLDGYGTDEDW